MTADFRTAEEKRGVHSELSLEEQSYPLLQALLSHLRRARQTPLQFGIDSEGIVGAALRDVDIPDAKSGRFQDWQVVTTSLDNLVDRSLQSERKGRVAQNPAGRLSQSIRCETSEPGSSHPLANWLDCLFRITSEVQPRAIDILALRVEGFHDRDIAERLGLGLRLVKSIIETMRTECAGASRVLLATTD